MTKAPPPSPIQPVELRADDAFNFSCYKGISCFNACCKNSEVALLPYDILRLKRRAGLSSADWVARYTVPFAMDAHELPGLKLATKQGSRECVFLTEEGCSVYEDRPSACRYYALGAMDFRRAPAKQPARADGAEASAGDEAGAVAPSFPRRRESPTANAPPATEEIYFIVKEAHCKGHLEPRRISVAEYRREQGLERYDAMNRGWRDLILKKRSAGPAVGSPSARSLQLFDMCSYDLDNFRAFVASDGFAEVFDLGATEGADSAELAAEDDKLLLFAYRFLRQVLFGEYTIALKPDAAQIRRAKKAARVETTERQRDDAGADAL